MTSLKLSPSSLIATSALYASSEKSNRFHGHADADGARLCQGSQRLEESHYIAEGHRLPPGVRSLSRTPAEVLAAPGARRSGTEGETGRRGDDHRAGWSSRSRGTARRADDAGGRPMVRTDRPSGGPPSGRGSDDARDRGPRDERGGWD